MQTLNKIIIIVGLTCTWFSCWKLFSIMKKRDDLIYVRIIRKVLDRRREKIQNWEHFTFVKWITSTTTRKNVTFFCRWIIKRIQNLLKFSCWGCGVNRRNSARLIYTIRLCDHMRIINCKNVYCRSCILIVFVICMQSYKKCSDKRQFVQTKSRSWTQAHGRGYKARGENYDLPKLTVP